MFIEPWFDIIRFTHFLGFALGIGAGAFADFSILGKLNSRLDRHDLANLATVHKIVWSGVVLLWASGLLLLYVQTGFALSQFSPKLVAKLMVVAVLTCNAFLLGIIAIPILKANANRSFLEFSLEHKTVLCLLGALSLGSWMSGLILGIFSFLRTANFELLVLLFSAVYLLAILSALLVAVLLHVIWERRGENLANIAGGIIEYGPNGALVPYSSKMPYIPTN